MLFCSKIVRTAIQSLSGIRVGFTWLSVPVGRHVRGRSIDASGFVLLESFASLPGSAVFTFDPFTILTIKLAKEVGAAPLCAVAVDKYWASVKAAAYTDYRG